MDLSQIQIETKVEALTIVIKRSGKKQHEIAHLLNCSNSYLTKVLNYKTPLTKKFEENINQLFQRIDGSGQCIY
ncbi:hypothetical protein LCY76_23475 [Fictibacillus sp. KIGAM418]|uniref:Uncharacterized protein n=1 Tax=Fictibacillus marinisediminis TaxID=2878389 RepID=A0A9X1XGK9_9BACL|nr:hypothetical protein [Fictibacillus marinisediminis]MCK6259535.1 hypothetical protein [Fictibacillus marinisediminis]